MRPPFFKFAAYQSRQPEPKLRKLSVADVVLEFYTPAAPSLPLRTFNNRPQCGGFGLTSAGAYIFPDNVGPEDLGLFSKGLFSLRLTIPRL